MVLVELEAWMATIQCSTCHIVHRQMLQLRHLKPVVHLFAVRAGVKRQPADLLQLENEQSSVLLY